MGRWWTVLRLRLRSLLRRDTAERELERELAFHLTELTAEYRAQGLSQRDAAAQARRAFADVAQTQERCRDQRRLGWLEDLGQDLHQAARTLRRAPGFAALAVLLLGVGIGGNATIYALMNGVFVKPLPGLREPESLVVLARTKQGRGNESNHSYPDYVSYRAGAPSLAGLAAVYNRHVGLQTGTFTQRIPAALVSPEYFTVLGVNAAAGRVLGPADADEGEMPMVLSHGLWLREFGGAATAVGKPIVIQGQPCRIVGVAPPRFRGAILDETPELWLPLRFAKGTEQWDAFGARDGSWVSLIGRLRSGRTVAQAQVEVDTIARRLQQTFPATNKDKGARVDRYNPLGAGAPPEVPQFMSILLAVASLATAAVCANVGGLLLARASGRKRELAIRMAMGGSRSRLVRQLLAEGLVLALAAGVLGYALSYGGAGIVVRLIPPERGEILPLDLTPDARVAGYAALLAFAAAFLAAFAPAWQATRDVLQPVLKAGEATLVPRRSRLRHGLVLAQVAVSVLLLAGAGLLVRSLYLLERSDARLQVNGLLLADLEPRANGYPDERIRATYEQLLTELAGVPGVQAAALGLISPFDGRGFSLGPVQGGTEPLGSSVNMNLISAGYLAVLGVPIVRGREFRRADRPGAPLVAIVNETLARRLWPDNDALGQTVRIGPDMTAQIVGVARDSRYRDMLEPAQPFLYLPLAQRTWGVVTLHVRTAGDPLRQLDAVRAAVARVDPQAPVFYPRSMAMQLAYSFGIQRLTGTLITAFGLFALLLAGVGLYGIMAFEVLQRRREIGIRLALGAPTRRLLVSTLQGGLRTVCLGLVCGLLLALGATRLLSFLLYGVTPADPLTYCGVAGVLLLTAVLASWLPARRAVRLDPIETLRWE